MPELTITLGKHKKGSIKLRRFENMLPGNMHRVLVKVGALLERQIKQNLSGPGHTRNPGSTNPFPGVLTNRLRSSVNFRVKDGRDDWEVRIGPNTVYAAVHEFGGGNTPKRPYVGPALDKRHNDVVDILNKRITEPLR